MNASVAIGVGLGAGGALVLRHAEAATALDHHRAVVARLRLDPLAPFRFGMTPDAEAVSAAAPEFRRVIALSADHVEIGLRCTEKDSSREPSGGRAWLQQAAARTQAADALSGRLACVPGVVALRDLGADGAVRRFALCVRRADAAEVAGSLPAAAQGFVADVSGPWPLYSFTPAGGRP
jgi:hypothetical protein